MVVNIIKEQNLSNSEYIDEITKKINHVQQHTYKISCIYCDENGAFIVFITEELK